MSERSPVSVKSKAKSKFRAAKKTEMGGREESPWSKGLYPIPSPSAKEAARGRGHPGGNL
jgi:hypothetical protein